MPDPRTLPTSPFMIVTSVEVQCSGGCPAPYGAGEPPLFETIDDAIRILRDMCWVFVGNRALCPGCAAAADCAVTGHQWTGWTKDMVEGLPCEQRTCQHCAVQEYDPPLAELEVLVRTMWDLNGGADAG
ncbi:hypothetical protein OOJ91_34325 [Micromonospora lupini]|uniref:hypothetical protein n=1 Tax=Micromonospora lupini TaxID=285679 RepID=UPI00225418B5|nr:hypothetical protein [Micromonospora lupini]MCX5070927.1 hypothetical protein [Micromonospora lupini]